MYGKYKKDEDILESLRTFAERSHKEYASPCMAVTEFNNKPIVAICSPIMQRAHTLVQSGELVFIDSTSNVDADNNHIYMLYTYSIAGGVPLGVFFSHSDSKDAIYEGIKLLKTVFPEK